MEVTKEKRASIEQFGGWPWSSVPRLSFRFPRSSPNSLLSLSEPMLCEMRQNTNEDEENDWSGRKRWIWDISEIHTTDDNKVLVVLVVLSACEIRILEIRGCLFYFIFKILLHPTIQNRCTIKKYLTKSVTQFAITLAITALRRRKWNGCGLVWNNHHLLAPKHIPAEWNPVMLFILAVDSTILLCNEY